MSDGRKSRVERRHETREHLLDAAATVFAERGYHAATVDAVAQEAGYTKGAVYSNFPSKEDLFLALVDDRLERQVAEVDQIMADSRDREDLLRTLSERMGDVPEPQSGREALASTDNAAWTVLALEAILYAVRFSPQLRTQLAARYRRVDEYNAAFAEAIGTHEHLAPLEAGIIQSALGDGLAMHTLLDPDYMSSQKSARAFQQAMRCLLPAYPPEAASESPPDDAAP